MHSCQQEGAISILLCIVKMDLPEAVRISLVDSIISEDAGLLQLLFAPSCALLASAAAVPLRLIAAPLYVKFVDKGREVDIIPQCLLL